MSAPFRENNRIHHHSRSSGNRRNFSTFLPLGVTPPDWIIPIPPSTSEHNVLPSARIADNSTEAAVIAPAAAATTSFGISDQFCDVDDESFWNKDILSYDEGDVDSGSGNVTNMKQTTTSRSLLTKTITNTNPKDIDLVSCDVEEQCHDPTEIHPTKVDVTSLEEAQQRSNVIATTPPPGFVSLDQRSTSSSILDQRKTVHRNVDLKKIYSPSPPRLQDLSVDCINNHSQNSFTTVSVMTSTDLTNRSTVEQSTISTNSSSYSLVYEGMSQPRHHEFMFGDNHLKRPFSTAIERPTIVAPLHTNMQPSFTRNERPTAALLQPPTPIGGSIIVRTRAPARVNCDTTIVTNVSGLSTWNDVETIIHDTPQAENEEKQPSSIPPLDRTSTSTIGIPKAKLHLLYGKPPRRKVITSEHYHTWHDSSPSHILKWTAIFVCPINAELFFAGRYFCGGSGATATSSSIDDRSNTGSILVWFVKKVNAEHAAAARAYDCMMYRDANNMSARTMDSAILEPTEMMGLEKPYLQPIYRLPELGIPNDIRQKIMAQQGEIRRIHGLPSVT
jgi:hypothetical protein